jgi:hypothetical protein
METIYFSETMGELLPDYMALTLEENTPQLISMFFV